MSPDVGKDAAKPAPAKSRSLSTQMKERGQRARAASRVIARAETGQKNAALFSFAELLRSEKGRILAANGVDLKAGGEVRLDPALMDRLELNDERIDAMADGVR